MTSSWTQKKLSELSLCEGLCEADTQALLAISEELTVPEGEYLFREGDPQDGLYALFEGKVEVHKRGQLLATVGPGGVLGEMSLLDNEREHRSASAKVTSAVRVIKIPRNRFEDLLRQNSVAALRLAYNVGRHLSQRLHDTGERLVKLLETNNRQADVAGFEKLLADWSF